MSSNSGVTGEVPEDRMRRRIDKGAGIIALKAVLLFTAISLTAGALVAFVGTKLGLPTWGRLLLLAVGVGPTIIACYRVVDRYRREGVKRLAAEVWERELRRR